MSHTKWATTPRQRGTNDGDGRRRAGAMDPLQIGVQPLAARHQAQWLPWIGTSSSERFRVDRRCTVSLRLAPGLGSTRHGRPFTRRRPLHAWFSRHQELGRLRFQLACCDRMLPRAQLVPMRRHQRGEELGSSWTWQRRGWASRRRTLPRRCLQQPLHHGAPTASVSCTILILSRRIARRCGRADLSAPPLLTAAHTTRNEMPGRRRQTHRRLVGCTGRTSRWRDPCRREPLAAERRGQYARNKFGYRARLCR